MPILLALYTLVGLWFVLKGAAIVDGRLIFTLFDDAMISMTYARNLASGHGLVWNPGDAPVEGFTNPLWTLMMALLHRMPIGEYTMSAAVSTLALLCLLRTLFNVYRASGNQLFPVVVTASSYSLLYWSLRGMEVGLLACLLTEILSWTRRYEEERKRSLVAIMALVALGVFTRMDALLWVGPLALFFFRNKDNKAVQAVVAAGAGSLAALTAVRLAYYGEWLPNTYYLKLTGSRTLERWHRGAAAMGNSLKNSSWPLMVFLGLNAVVTPPKAWWQKVELPLTLALLQIGYCVHVGGDAWEWYRFPNRYFSVIVPCLALAVAPLYSRLTQILITKLAWRRTGEAFLFGLLTYVAFAGEWVHWGRLFWQRPIPSALEWQQTELALTFARYVKPTTKVAVFNAGLFCYFSHVTCLDALGKSDKHIARKPAQGAFYPGHDKTDYAYTFLDLNPDIVVGPHPLGSVPDFLAQVQAKTPLRRTCDHLWFRQDRQWPDSLKTAWNKDWLIPDDIGLGLALKARSLVKR